MNANKSAATTILSCGPGRETAAARVASRNIAKLVPEFRCRMGFGMADAAKFGDRNCAAIPQWPRFLANRIRVAAVNLSAELPAAPRRAAAISRTLHLPSSS